MKLSDYAINNPITTTLLRSERITPADSSAEVRHLVLQLPEGPFEYFEGQSIGVLAPGPHEFGNHHHLRLYSIANPRGGEDGRPDTISICVRRCFSIDDISGERYPGRASNFLCDANPGDPIPIIGPLGNQFEVPADPTTNMLMIGAGTGIAPFRAFVKRIYQVHRGWEGKVRLFYGARTGMELLYQNDIRNDLALYYDHSSFKAFEALSPKPHYDAPPAFDSALLDNASEVWEMIENPKTFVYVAGLISATTKFEQAMAQLAGSDSAWQDKKANMIASQRYTELLYE